MARPKGTPKTGGRVKGTPNKVTYSLKEWINSLIRRNQKQIELDLEEIEPKERLQILLKLLEYIIPKAKAETEEQVNSNSQISLIQQTINDLNRLQEENNYAKGTE